MKNRSILLFYPHNVFDQNCGINNRYLNLLKYFKSRECSVDIFTLDRNCRINPDKVYRDLTSNIYIYKDSVFDLKKFLRRVYLKTRKIIFRIECFTLPDLSSDKMKREFKKKVSKKKYDLILISYINWARLIDDPFFDNQIKVLDLSDFTTHQLYEKANGKINIGAVFNEEIDRINLFDKIMAVSESEHYLFSQFCNAPEFYYVPIFMEEGISRDGAPDHDLLIVGSDNPHNIKGVNWFFNNVYNFLERSMTIAVAGGISDYVPEGENIKKIGRLDDLAEVYNRSKIALSPLLSGSGMKVKVVEALSYGLPVVATVFGSTGISASQANGVFVADDPFKFSTHIKRLLSGSSHYKESSKNALKYFIGNFSSEIVHKNLDKIFLQ